MQKRIALLFLCYTIFIVPSFPHEGMWLPWHLPQSQIDKMHEMGFKLAPEDIFSATSPSIKDAVVSLENGSCTGSFISYQGLLLTNHHCASSDIQKHSSVEQNLLMEGFWAQSRSQEIPNPGKTATLLIDAQDLTDLFQSSLRNVESSIELESKIDSLSQVILDTLTLAPTYEATIKDFSFNNRFYLITTQTFRDVRLVAAPPEEVAQFGGEKDNWTWPRHSADFALYRVYCSPEGLPASYHPDNIPFTPSKSLKIDINGIEQQDFTLTLGYPGNTQRYTVAPGIKETYEVINPVIADVRKIKQQIWKKHMEHSPLFELKYAEKYATLMNYLQYATLQNKRIKALNIIEQQREYEEALQRRISNNPSLENEYGNLVPSFEILYRMRENLARTSYITLETLLSGTELSSFVLETFELFSSINNNDSSPREEAELINTLKRKASLFFRDFSPEVDKEVFLEVLDYYQTNLADSLSINDSTLLGNYKSRENLASAMYSQSAFSSEDKFQKLMLHPKISDFLTDPAFSFYLRILQEFGPAYAMFNRMDRQLDYSMHRYFNLLSEIYPQKEFYPDANSTMRLSYGKIEGYVPKDGIFYDPFTSAAGIHDKINSGSKAYQSKFDFTDLFEQDWNDFYREGKSPQLCFISTNDISGGNSGSPVLNQKGDLVGLAFDSNGEGMASDLSYSRRYQRCINVDIRYIFFLIDQLGQANWLLQEIEIQK